LEERHQARLQIFGNENTLTSLVHIRELMSTNVIMREITKT